MKPRPRSGEARSGAAHSLGTDARFRLTANMHPASLAAAQFAVLQLAKDALADIAAVQDLRIAVDEVLQAAAVTGIDTDVEISVTTTRRRVEVELELPEVPVDRVLLEGLVDRVDVAHGDGGIRVHLVHDAR